MNCTHLLQLQALLLSFFLASPFHARAQDLPPFVWALGPFIEAVGTDVELHPAILGDGPMTYQWRFQGRVLPGKTEDFLRLPAVGSKSAGTYTLVARNAAGVSTKDFSLTVYEPVTCTLRKAFMQLHPALISIDGFILCEVPATLVTTSPETAPDSAYQPTHPDNQSS